MTHQKSVIREVRIINEAIYVDIIAAGSAQTRPMIKKTTPGDSGDTRTHGREHRSQIETRIQPAREREGGTEEDARTNTTQHH